MEIFKQAWPWYVTGPLIGLMVPLLLIFGNKMFGISSTLRHLCAACIPAKVPYFRYDWKKESWNLVFALGIVAGAWLAAQYMTWLPQEHLLHGGHPGDLRAQALLGEKNIYPHITPEARALFDSWRLNSLYRPAPAEIFDWQQLLHPVGLIFMVLGGFLVGFGTRYANGCTSGHSIMGLSQLSPASLVATIGFFAGGLVSSWLLVPYFIQHLL